MKHAICATVAALALAGATHGDMTDPTAASDAIAQRLKAYVADSQKLQALVVGNANEGVALVNGKICRAGSVLAEVVDGVKVEVAVEEVTDRGVKLSHGAFLGGSFTPLPPPEGEKAEFIRYIECDNVPIAKVMRLVADQSGVNIAVSDEAAEKPVSVFLRNVSVDGAVEEVCRATGLLSRREKNILRIMTKAEYGENLNTFREEATEMFTLLYPNVIEVASAIYGIYPDRTFLSLGEEEFEEDDEYDLGRRFRRFRVLEDNGGSQFMGMEAPQSSVGSSRSGGGNFSYTRGGMMGRLSQWDELRRRNRNPAYALQGETLIAPDDAKLLENAMKSGDTNLFEQVRGKVALAANIFVTVSRKNNMLIVRTSDMRALDEIRAMVRKLDVPTPMVLMEVKVLELSVDDNYEASFSYSFNRGTHALGHNGSGADNIFADLVQSGKDSFNPSFAFKAVSDNITAQIRLLQQDGKIKTLATPTLLVANNEVSRIFSGKEYPLVTGWTPSDTVVSESGIVQGAMTVQITKEDVGTMLLITPNINADKTVTLRLLQENSAVCPDKVLIPVDGGSGESKEIEYVESRSLAGTFVANDGMTIMAGGLVKETEGETYWRTPILGSIPLVGWLFRGTEKVKERTELIVLIKPHVILTPMEGGKISKELMDALSAHPAADGAATMGIHNPDTPHSVRDDARNITR